MKSFSDDLPGKDEMVFLHTRITTLQHTIEKMKSNITTAMLFAILGISVGVGGFTFAYLDLGRIQHIEQTK